MSWVSELFNSMLYSKRNPSTQNPPNNPHLLMNADAFLSVVWTPREPTHKMLFSVTELKGPDASLRLGTIRKSFLSVVLRLGQG